EHRRELPRHRPVPLDRRLPHLGRRARPDARQTHRDRRRGRGSDRSTPMRVFANPCGSDAVVAAMQAGVLGYLDTPAQGNTRPTGVTWCADNGCFSDRWDEAKWLGFLEANTAHADTCAFAVVPDVVADAAATLVRFEQYAERVRGLGYPVALVAQDG